MSKEPILKLVILGEVQSQLRPIISTVGTGGKKAVAIDPPKCREYKKKVAETAKNYYKGKPLDEPLRVEVDVYRSIPKSWSKKKRQDAISGLIYPVSKPDTENLSKGICDGISGIVWRDDSIIVEHEIKKYYSEVPRAEVRVYKIND